MAAEKGFGFDADSVKRISDVVRRVEREYPNPSPKRGRRVPGGHGPELVRVKLQENHLRLSSLVSVKKVTLNATTTTISSTNFTEVGNAFDALDLFTAFRGVGAGQYAYVKRFPDSNKYELIHARPPAKWVHGTLNSAVATTDATPEGTVSAFWDGYGIYSTTGFTASTGVTITLQNWAGWQANSGAKYQAILHIADGSTGVQYRLDNVVCPTTGVS